MPALWPIKYLKNHAEVPLFLLFFAFMFSDSVKTNLIIFRTCYVTLGYDKAECALLGSQKTDNRSAELEKLVEPHAAYINMIHTLIEGFCTSTVCLFVGSWSDRFGRKPILIIPLIGFLMYYLLVSVFATFENLSPWYSLVCLLPICVTGGTSTYLTGVLCHTTDLTTDQNRGIKMGVIEVVIFLGIFLGTISSSYILASTSYPIVFFLGATCCFLSLLFTLGLISESLINPEPEYKFSELFQLSSIKTITKITFKRRENYARCTILCCGLLTTLSIVIMMGQGAVISLFLREKFHWSLQQYTLYSAIASCVSVSGTILGLYILHKLLKIPETVLILVAVLSGLNGALMMGLAQTDTVVYTVPFFTILHGTFSPMNRSLISKVVPSDEVGKIFALLTAAQFLFGIIGSPLYTFVYNETISESPGYFNFVTAGIHVFEIFVVMYTPLIVVRTFNVNSYDVLTNENSHPRQSISNEPIN